MPRKSKNAATEQTSVPEIPKELPDQFVTGPMTAEAAEAVMRKFKKAVIERALGAEMTHHLGYPPGAAKLGDTANHCNGKSAKMVLNNDGELRVEILRDRAGTFEPQLIGKHEPRFSGFDDKIVAMYARSMTMREIQPFLHKMYNVEVSTEFISSAIDAVMSEVTAWQANPWTAPRLRKQALTRHPLQRDWKGLRRFLFVWNPARPLWR